MAPYRLRVVHNSNSPYAGAAATWVRYKRKHIRAGTTVTHVQMPTRAGARKASAYTCARTQGPGACTEAPIRPARPRGKIRMPTWVRKRGARAPPQLKLLLYHGRGCPALRLVWVLALVVVVYTCARTQGANASKGARVRPARRRGRIRMLTWVRKEGHGRLSMGALGLGYY